MAAGDVAAGRPRPCDRAGSARARPVGQTPRRRLFPGCLRRGPTGSDRRAGASTGPPWSVTPSAAAWQCSSPTSSPSSSSGWSWWPAAASAAKLPPRSGRPAFPGPRSPWERSPGSPRGGWASCSTAPRALWPGISRPEVDEVAQSITALADPGARDAFVHTVRNTLDLGGQRLNGLERLRLVSDAPLLLIAGRKDLCIPTDTPPARTTPAPEAASNCSRPPGTSPTATSHCGSLRSSWTSSRPRRPPTPTCRTFGAGCATRPTPPPRPQRDATEPEPRPLRASPDLGRASHPEYTESAGESATPQHEPVARRETSPPTGPCELSDHGERLSIILGILDTGCPDPVPLRAGHGYHVAEPTCQRRGNP